MPFKTAAFTANAPGCRVTKNRPLTLFWPVYACIFFYVDSLDMLCWLQYKTQIYFEAPYRLWGQKKLAQNGSLDCRSYWPMKI